MPAPAFPRCRCRYLAKGVVEFGRTDTVYDQLSVLAAAATQLVCATAHLLALPFAAVSGSWLVFAVALASLLLGVGVTAHSLRQHGRRDLSWWHVGTCGMGCVREAYVLLWKGCLVSTAAGVDLRLDVPMLGHRAVIHTFMLHALWSCPVHAAVTLWYILDATCPGGSVSTTQSLADATHSVLLASAVLCMVAVGMAVALSDRFFLYVPLRVFVGCFAWLLGCLVAWLLGCLVAWLLGCLVACSVSTLAPACAVLCCAALCCAARPA